MDVISGPTLHPCTASRSDTLGHRLDFMTRPLDGAQDGCRVFTRCGIWIYVMFTRANHPSNHQRIESTGASGASNQSVVEPARGTNLTTFAKRETGSQKSQCFKSGPLKPPEKICLLLLSHPRCLCQNLIGFCHRNLSLSPNRVA